MTNTKTVNETVIFDARPSAERGPNGWEFIGIKIDLDPANQKPYFVVTGESSRRFKTFQGAEKFFAEETGITFTLKSDYVVVLVGRSYYLNDWQFAEWIRIATDKDRHAAAHVRKLKSWGFFK